MPDVGVVREYGRRASERVRYRRRVRRRAFVVGLSGCRGRGDERREHVGKFDSGRRRRYRRDRVAVRHANSGSERDDERRRTGGGRRPAVSWHRVRRTRLSFSADARTTAPGRQVHALERDRGAFAGRRLQRIDSRRRRRTERGGRVEYEEPVHSREVHA